jgi:pimeloyl-ACP methyl ester carboxylesterase
VMAAAGDDARCVAIDLPGIGGSKGAVDKGSKRAIADVVHALIGELGLPADTTLVGHDAGGMVAYAYLRAYTDVARVVIVNTVIPGVPPWDDVIRRPEIFHFAFHQVPHIPELLVQGRQLPYLGLFYDVLSADPKRITPDRRASYATAYGDDGQLAAGFDLYRGFPGDVTDNQHAAEGPPCTTPLLYIRGDHDKVDIEAYAKGFRAAGVRHLATAVVRDAGHFVGDEQPAELWRVIRDDHRARAAA